MRSLLLRRRGILITATLLALATLSVGTAIKAYYYRLPDPATADGRGIIRWMVLRDLGQEPVEVRRTLLARIETTLAGKDLGGGNISDRLDPKYRERFWSNVDVMLSEWFQVQAARYAAAPEEKKPGVLDKVLDEAEKFASFKRDKTPANGANDGRAHRDVSESTAAVGKSDQANSFTTKVNQWIQDAPEAERPSLRRFAAALTAAYAKRTFQSLFNSFTAGTGETPAQ